MLNFCRLPECLSKIIFQAVQKPWFCLILQAINASAQILPTVKSKVDLSKIINIQGFSLEKVLQMDPNFLDVSVAAH